MTLWIDEASFAAYFEDAGNDVTIEKIDTNDEDTVGYEVRGESIEMDSVNMDYLGTYVSAVEGTLTFSTTEDGRICVRLIGPETHANPLRD